MLETIGVASVEELFADVPHAQRFPRLDLPDGMSEPEVAALFRRYAGANGAVDTHSCFLGAGAYHHYTPALVPHLLFRSELYTAYTPYQPEVSQGTLQTIFEFQTMVARLFGMEVANASLYDGSTALAEAALMAARLRAGRRTVVVSAAVHPEYRQVLATYLSGIGLRIVTVPFDRETGATDRGALQEALDADTAAVLTQYPNFLGVIEPLEELVEMTHAAGALAVASADPVALATLRPPGELGVDIATAEGQPLGIPLFYGGPYVGLLATSMRNVRQMPGRLAGIAHDERGRRGFVLTLKPREQDIRREKATSNICTNEALIATAVAIYLAAMGPSGLREVAEQCYHRSHYLAAELARVAGVDARFSGRFFREVVVRPPVAPAELNRRLWAEHGIVGGLDLGRFDLGLEGCWLLTATELNSRADIDRLVAGVEEVAA
jgi:glycine dehydrogenase subunit 1